MAGSPFSPSAKRPPRDRSLDRDTLTCADASRIVHLFVGGP